MNNRRQIFANIPPATKGLLILNIILFALTYLLKESNILNLKNYLALFYFNSELFLPHQIVTHMFMHGNLMHLVFNMYALWLFGQIIERRWGTKRFLIYYFVTGLGAAAIQMMANHYQTTAFAENLSPEQIDYVAKEGWKLVLNEKNWVDVQLGGYNGLLNSSMLGASGAVMGLLLAFGMLFPNIELRLMFIPIPIKAKYFVIGYAALELFMGVGNFQWDNIAHYAHLGGMLFGLIFIKLWGKDSSSGGNHYQQY